MSKRIYLTFLLTITFLSVLACSITPLPTEPHTAELGYKRAGQIHTAPEVVLDAAGAGKAQRWEP